MAYINSWLNKLYMMHISNFSLGPCYVFVVFSDAAAAYAYRDHAQLQLIGKHFESGILQVISPQQLAVHYLRQGGYVIVVVCLCVCRSAATLRKNSRTDLHELVSWSLTSLFSTNMAISETNGHSL